jgi:hypothetical protein
MIDQIKKRAHVLKESMNKEFEANVRIFNTKAKKSVEEIFKDTNYNDRKKVRLDNWKNKKYRKRSEL